MAITRNVLQVLVICLFFIIAFGLSLHILAGNTQEHSNFGYSLFKVFGLMFGDFSYIFFVRSQNDGELYYTELTFIFVITMTIIMAIVFQNLLIGLSLGHIEEIRLNAIAEKRAIEIGFYKRIDSNFLRKRAFWKLNHESRKHTIHPNKNVLWIRQIWRHFWRTLKGLDMEASLPTDNSHSVEQELVGINARIDELVVTQERMAETQEKLLDMVNQILSAQHPPKLD